MRTWAVITNGVVTNLVVADHDLHLTHGGDVWIDITDVVPSPQVRWTYDANTNTFTPPQE